MSKELYYWYKEHGRCPKCGGDPVRGTDDNTAKCISDINNIVDTGGFFYYSMYFDGVPEKQLIADIAETYVVSTETATAAFKEILRQWK